jgi:hypothetical protein
MSDLYLQLRSRIPVVAAQTIVGSARLQEAQDAVGLSNEAIARQIPVSEKTWRRWKEAGTIPTASLPAVARALRLELIEPDRGKLVVPEQDRLAAIERHLESLAGAVASLQEGMERVLDAVEGGSSKRRASPKR